MPLRDYQLDSSCAVIEGVDGHQILTLPTGAGKTHTAAHIVRELGRPTLWLAHRTELIQQAERTLREDYHLNTGIIQSGYDKDPMAIYGRNNPPVWVASVQTLVRRKLPSVGLAVIDECHHSTAATYGKILRELGCPRLGLTATPFRLDGRGLGDLFDSMVIGATVQELIEAGHLHEPKVFGCKAPDMDGIKASMGDYQVGQSAEAMTVLNGDIVKTWKEKANRLKTVAFCVNVGHSKSLAAEFATAGVRSAHVDGTTPPTERAAHLEALRTGQIDVLCNCMILTEGWDLPALEAAIIARPTKSLNLHFQMIGRIMRKDVGKDGAIVLDHGGNHARHGFVTWPIKFNLDPGLPKAEASKLGMKRCPGCFRLLSPSTMECPECGHKFESKNNVETDDADMVQLVDPLKLFEDKVAAWEAMKNLGYARANYKKIYGEWPVLAGDRLIDVDNATMEDKRLVYRGFVEAGISSPKVNQVSGFAAHRYKDIFGVWPKGFVNEELLRAGIQPKKWKGRYG